MEIVGALLTVADPSGTPPVSTWDPVDLNANIVLSGGDLDAASGTAAANQNYCGRNTLAISTGDKKYTEIEVTALDPSPMILGIVNATFPFNDGHYLGIDTDGTALAPDGSVYYDNGVVASFDPYVQGDVIGIAVDFDAGLIWWQFNGSDWNADPSADPATGTGGHAIPLTGDAHWAYDLNYDGATQASITMHVTPYDFTVPTGFTGYS